MSTDLKRFFIKFIIFIIPFVIVFSFPVFVMLVSGELVSIDKVIRAQYNSKKPVLFGLAYSNPDLYYKLGAVLHRKPEIIVLGASRATFFSSRFFREPEKFYNAGKAVARLSHLKYFLDRIPVNAEPKIIMLVLDHNFFSPKWDNFTEDYLSRDPAEKNNWIIALKHSWISVYKDYVNQKYEIADLFSNEQGAKRFGMSAIINGSGFRNDGSYLYAHEIKNINDPQANKDYNFLETINKINSGGDRFEHSLTISTKSISELEYFLRKCHERNIYVVGILPPYAETVFKKLKSLESNYAYIFKISRTLEPVFSRFGFSLFDFTNPADIGSSDTEFIDGLHASEKAFLRIMILISREDKNVGKYVDVNHLNNSLLMSNSNFLVF